MCFGVLFDLFFFCLPFSSPHEKHKKKKMLQRFPFWHLTDGNTGLWAGRESEVSWLVKGRSRQAARALDRRPAGVSCRGGWGVSKAAAASVKAFSAAYTPRSCISAATRVIASISLAQQVSKCKIEAWDCVLAPPFLDKFLIGWKTFLSDKQKPLCLYMLCVFFCQTFRSINLIQGFVLFHLAPLGARPIPHVSGLKCGNVLNTVFFSCFRKNSKSLKKQQGSLKWSVAVHS